MYRFMPSKDGADHVSRTQWWRVKIKAWCKLAFVQIGQRALPSSCLSLQGDSIHNVRTQSAATWTRQPLADREPKRRFAMPGAWQVTGRSLSCDWRKPQRTNWPLVSFESSPYTGQHLCDLVIVTLSECLTHKTCLYWRSYLECIFQKEDPEQGHSI